MTVRGFFDAIRSGWNRAHPSHLLGPLVDLPEFGKSHNIDVIFISLPLRHVPRVHDLLDALGHTTASLYYLPDVRMSEFIQARTDEILGVPVIAMRETRLMDVSLATPVLLAMAPLLLGIAAAIGLTSPGPIVFRQRHYGLDGREIVIYKFRTSTMSVVEDSGGISQARRDDVQCCSRRTGLIDS